MARKKEATPAFPDLEANRHPPLWVSGAGLSWKPPTRMIRMWRPSSDPLANGRTLRGPRELRHECWTT
jgi:hypothetical protein